MRSGAHPSFVAELWDTHGPVLQVRACFCCDGTSGEIQIDSGRAFRWQGQQLPADGDCPVLLYREVAVA